MEQKKEQHTRESLSAHFKDNKASKVIFTKKDGTERTMLCSLHPDLLPKSSGEAGEKTTSRPTPEHLSPVFDIKTGGWRSITMANIISIEAYEINDEAKQ